MHSKLFDNLGKENDKILTFYASKDFFTVPHMCLMTSFYTGISVKGTVMQIEKGLINDRLCVSKVS